MQNVELSRFRGSFWAWVVHRPFCEKAGQLHTEGKGLVLLL